MTEFVQVMKKAAIDAVEQTKPCALSFGEVISEDGEPLEIALGPKVVLTGSQIIFLASATVRQGDKVALISIKGGGRYLLLGKVTG